MTTRKLRIAPRARVELEEAAAAKTFGLTKERVEAERPALAEELADLQELLFAAGRHSLLVILQGMDTSGKDGTVKSVMEPVNPVGVVVHSFKVPSEEELAHDFLWRVHEWTPRRGMIGIFNRSHYEDVTVVRVHRLVPPAVWRKRFRHINEFERTLVDAGTIVLKYFMHISRKEQEERLLAREQEVTKAWKLSAGDWREREHWDEYRAAYEEAITKTNTDHAPWHVVPSDKKWARNHLVLRSVVEGLRPYREEWVDVLEELGEEKKAELAAFREKRN
jgi:PPK2 family polyphosphate:nucleotide phosphotransferase